MVGIRGTFSTPSVSSFIVNQKDGERDVCLQDIPDIQVLRKGQVALEGNFRFVQDKSDLKSASDKKFVRKATVALENKICEQNTTPCCERLAISREAAFNHCPHPQSSDTRNLKICYHEEFSQ